MARPRARPKRIFDDGLDRASATPAFSTAAEAVIDLLGTTRKVIRRAHGVADIMVAKDVAGTDDHNSVVTFGLSQALALEVSFIAAINI
jgi:hypothetical protein